MRMRDRILRTVLYVGFCAVLGMLFWKRTAILHKFSNDSLGPSFIVPGNHPISKWSALHWAACDGRTSDVKRLLAEGADIESKTKEGEAPLHCAAALGRKETVGYLISKGADINSRNGYNSTPLHLAAAGGHVETVRLLLSAGADVNARSRNGETPLDCVTRMMKNRAFRKELEPCAELLREHAAKEKQ